jgi:hypothetical protein
MMPDPLTTHLISKIWDGIDKAVKSGLAWPVQDGPSHPALADVVIVNTEQINRVEKWDSDKSEEIRCGQCRIRECRQVSDFMYRFPLSYDDLNNLDKDQVKDWASAVREKELTYTLRLYADAAGAAHPYNLDDLFKVDPAGWGKRRCVVFRSVANPPKTFPDNWPSADLDRTVKLDIIPRQGSIEALVFRIAGGPYVRRPADLSLGWMPADDYGAELILTERLEFVGIEVENNVIGVKMA